MSLTLGTPQKVAPKLSHSLRSSQDLCQHQITASSLLHASMSRSSLSWSGGGELLTETELRLLRAKDLRKILFDLGFSQNEVRRHIDKNELIGLILAAFQSRKDSRSAELNHLFLLRTSFIAFLVVLAVVFHKQLLHALVAAIRYIWGEHWMFQEKFRLIRKSVKYRLFLAGSCLVLSCFIDCIIPLINLSTLLSWFVPSDSLIRNYLFPSPYIPLSPSSALGTGSTMGLNVGPMLMLWILKILKNKLENSAAEQLLNYGTRR